MRPLFGTIHPSRPQTVANFRERDARIGKVGKPAKQYLRVIICADFGGDMRLCRIQFDAIAQSGSGAGKYRLRPRPILDL
jgi:hypothetical protein